MTGRILVVDLGAGTLDLSYIEAEKGLFEVQQIFGDSQFGSGDFDPILVQELVTRLKQDGLTELTALDRRRLNAAAEQLKVSLSSSGHATYELVSFAQQARYTLTLTAERLGELLAPHLLRLDKVCRQAAGLKMDHLVLVGGPMFSPIIRRSIEAVFQRKADSIMDPRTAVAMGAACQGAMFSNPDQVPFLLMDIMPFALGVLAQEADSRQSKVSFHIPRGTSIPHQSAKPYTTTKDNQTRVTVEVFQGLGDVTDPSANSRIAQFHLDGIPPAKAGEPQIDIRFQIDANGLLEVTARDEKSGRAKSLRMEDRRPHKPGSASSRLSKGLCASPPLVILAPRIRRSWGRCTTRDRPLVINTRSSWTGRAICHPAAGILSPPPGNCSSSPPRPRWSSSSATCWRRASRWPARPGSPWRR